MRQQRATLTIQTRGPGFTDVTSRIERFVREAGIVEGLLTVFVPHTSASLLIQENADPDVLRDLAEAFMRLAPRDADYRHRTEGPDDMPAHVRAALTQTSLSIPVSKGKPALGVWQAVYLFERQLIVHALGD